MVEEEVVDDHAAGFDLVRDVLRGPHAGAEDVGTETVDGVIRDANGFVDLGIAADGQRRTEGFLLPAQHVVLDVDDDRRRKEAPAVFVARLAAGEHPCPFCAGIGDVTANHLDLVGDDHAAQVDLLLRGRQWIALANDGPRSLGRDFLSIHPPAAQLGQAGAGIGVSLRCNKEPFVAFAVAR